MPGNFGPIQRWLLAAWFVPFVVYFAYVFVLPEPSLDQQASRRTSLRVYSNTHYFREMEKPVEFGLEKLTSVVNYLLLVAAAILAFVTKSVMEFRSQRVLGTLAQTGHPTRTQYLLFLHVGIACLFSLTWGVLAFLSLPNITVVETFAVTGFLSRCVLGQIAGLLFSIFLLLFALGGVIRNLLP